MKRSRVALLSLVLVLLPYVSSGTASERTEIIDSENLGTIDFPTSGAPVAHSHFVRGIKLLHNFEFPDARAAFHEAQTIEPGFAMAYWGEAMTHYAPLWERIERASGRSALAKLAATAEERRALVPTERERMYFDAIELLLGDGAVAERSAAFAQAMEAVARRFPEDQEARVFQALGILGTADGRDVAIYEQAADIAEAVFKRKPRHPGAAHYLIHATDDPLHARRGLPAARVYGDFAAASPHALHMPAHIFLPLGMWRQAADANRASIESAPEGSTHASHAYPWLLHATVQLGRYRAARAILDELGSAESWTLERTWKRMRDLYVVETGTCPDDLIGPDAPRGTRASAAFVRGLCALRGGDLAGAREALDEVGEGTDGAKLLHNVLAARIALANGDIRKAIRLARRAVALDEQALPTRDEYGPGTPLEPPEETLGTALLAAGRPDEARQAFARALAVRPNRVRGLIGLIAAAEAGGDPGLAASTRAHLDGMWSEADGEVRARFLPTGEALERAP